ncbi:MAG TPA: DUF2059 domain-containing protein [Candidatus Acidoferrum sp.]
MPIETRPVRMDCGHDSLRSKSRFLGGLSILFLLACNAPAQTVAPKSSAAPSAKATTANGASKIDPAKEADIRRLLEVAGAKALALQTMNEMFKSIKPVLTNTLPAGEYREKLVDAFFARFMAKADSNTLLDLAVPEYDKNFTREEIRGLIQFYESPLGKKAITVVPQLMAELQTKGRKWGEDLGRQSMLEVLAEHPEFEKQMEEAQKSAQDKN